MPRIVASQPRARAIVASGIRYFSFTSPSFRDVVPLAYQVYAPPKEIASDADRKAPILFMHGLFGSQRNNRTISKQLVRDLKRPIYTIDLRNHGESPHHPKHDYNAMADDVEGFIEQHKLGQVALIGHSMGAKTAMTVALRSPDLVESFVSVDNAPIDAALHSDFPGYVRGMRKIEEAGVKKQSEADEILKEFEESLPIRQFLLTNLVRPQGSPFYKFRVPVKILASALDDMADFPFKDPDKARYERPALFIRGTDSHYIPGDVIPLIGRFFPRFQLKDVKSGHWVISENPEEFRRVVVEFLEDQT